MSVETQKNIWCLHPDCMVELTSFKTIEELDSHMDSHYIESDSESDSDDVGESESDGVSENESELEIKVYTSNTELVNIVVESSIENAIEHVTKINEN